MNKTVQIGVVTAAIAVGVVLGAILFRQRHEPTPAAPRPAPSAAAPVAPDELARAVDRIGVLETQLRALQAKVDLRAGDKEALLKDLKDQFAAESKAVFEGELDDKDSMPFGWRIPHKPQSIAGLLGLDAARRKTLEDTYKSFVDRIRTLEKEHAKTTVDGDTTRIEIEPFPNEGKVLIADWSSRLTALLTPDEKDKYKRLGLGLLPADIGQHERVIAIVDEGDGTASSTEHSGEGKGFSGSYKGPKEMALAPYRHLLKK
jgi:hypothetical protein